MSRGRWLAEHSSGAPAPLRERVEAYLGEVPGELELPRALAHAGGAALDRAIAAPKARAAALDLLAADALVTLALLAQAETAPEGLAAFAGSLLTRAGGVR